MTDTYTNYVQSMTVSDLRTVLAAIDGYAHKTADDIAARAIIRRELQRRGKLLTVKEVTGD